MTSSDPARDRAAEPAAGAGDPSMEDILASIRRILSEDEPAAQVPPAGKEATDDDVLVLDASMMVHDPNPPAPEPEPEPAYTHPVQAEPVRNVAFTPSAILYAAETLPRKRSRASRAGFCSCSQNGLLWKL